MCLWEAALEARTYHGPNTPNLDPLNTYWGDVGTSQLRSDVARFLPALEMGWLVHSKDEEATLIPYDWEFCPYFLHNCLEWDPNRGAALKPDWLDRCRFPSKYTKE